jgi:hypothetical protein
LAGRYGRGFPSGGKPVQARDISISPAGSITGSSLSVTEAVMSAFIATLAIILAVVVIMAIGVIFGRRPITGSCGGLALLGLECDCDNPCPKKLARLRALNGADGADADKGRAADGRMRESE